MGHKTNIGFEVRTLDNMLMRNFACSVKESGLDELTVMHGWIIAYLYQNLEREIYQKDIESRFSIGRSTVTNILKLMEKKGYLLREPVDRDARLKRLRLTETGIQLHEDTQHLIELLDEKTIQGISQEELEVFTQVVYKLKQNIEKQHAERKSRFGGAGQQEETQRKETTEKKLSDMTSCTERHRQQGGKND